MEELIQAAKHFKAFAKRSITIVMFKKLVEKK